ncbi:hypothetical protein H4S02_000873 [Coemansia sp. RSA 2611]|nr:hypothetical protein H4S01_001274 [Coemansia sp. RSA 2610]KAJ2392281.1 hypothetical protein H4S02_000873 [Coemansia sp. RSA 2611]
MPDRQPQSDDRLYMRSPASANAGPSSMPNIKIHARPAPRVYAGLYAASYASDSEPSDSEAADAESPGALSPVEAVVLGFERSAPRLPALRIGAARLSEMVHARGRADASAISPSVAATRDINDDSPNHAANHSAASDDSPKQHAANHNAAFGDSPNHTANYDHDAGAANHDAGALPRRLARASVKRSPHGPEATSRSPTPCASRASHDDGLALPALPAAALENIDHCNGLLAPGAFGDEKQRARADGSAWQRLLYAVRRGRREREAKLFRPVVVRPGRAPQPEGEDEEDARIMSKFPFCCCAARYCVAFSFVAVILAALIGFFAWPRMPSVSISSLTPLAPAHTTHDPRNSLFGLRMPLRIAYEIHSGNFYPLRIASAHVRGFDGVTGNRIIDTTLHDVRVAPLRMQFHTASTQIDYLTSDMADPALTDLFGKCAPRSAHFARANGSRPGALTIRFQITVNVAGLHWLKQPVVTLNQKVDCPE